MDSLKLKFFTWHLIASISIVLTLSIVCQYLWFPAPFLQLDGTWRALLILAAVDIVIGPILTLLLVSSKKSTRELFIDMVIIIAIQLSALGYGLTKIEQERVWAIVHLDGMFNLVPKKEVSPAQLAIKHKLPKYNGSYYAMVLNSELLLNAKESGNLIYYSPKRYHPISKAEISKQQITYADLPDDIKEKYHDDYVFKFLAGKIRDAVVVFNEKLELIDIMIISQE